MRLKTDVVQYLTIASKAAYNERQSDWANNHTQRQEINVRNKTEGTIKNGQPRDNLKKKYDESNNSYLDHCFAVV